MPLLSAAGAGLDVGDDAGAIAFARGVLRTEADAIERVRLRLDGTIVRG